MARRCIRAAALAALSVSLCASSAFAHAGNPHYESLVEGVSPRISGFSVTVLNGDDRLEVINHSSKTITIDGYNDEPYLRMDADGTVSVNVRSPAFYLNTDRTDTAPVPDSADPKAAPQWKVVGHDGRYQFHDHRIHWMSTSTPQQVTDTSKRTKVVDWRVPLQAGGSNGAISGTLFWRGSSGGPPAGAFVALALILLLGAGTVVLVRRRRGAGGEGGAGGAGEGGAGGAHGEGGAGREGGAGGEGGEVEGGAGGERGEGGEGGEVEGGAGGELGEGGEGGEGGDGSRRGVSEGDDGAPAADRRTSKPRRAPKEAW